MLGGVARHRIILGYVSIQTLFVPYYYYIICGNGDLFQLLQPGS